MLQLAGRESRSPRIEGQGFLVDTHGQFAVPETAMSSGKFELEESKDEKVRLKENLQNQFKVKV
eukprot:CAMPEP_0185595914 /NCGR_PEP_ID=MMETSP0434-20130131/79957_1 /TAXON_ID=626734 ORGANISM="Favella taraikaensis, Strain Fe Narragansett Bay" /NCGR_SAMPLE_ID=MMETSP0434 /ASSEMBLY_ACC=CAM_ASM_000379 /LENGTH=63 /DNA_ID=CAMNT_0028224225 /DNA_START=248 /DNA_END=435 /DNA_ORIENTATION=-